MCLLLLYLFFDVVVIWTEVTFFSWSVSSGKVDLSLFSLMLNTAYTPFAVELLVFLPVAYMAFCVLHSLFSIRVLHFYRFLPKATNARTLLYSASFVGRLIPPLVYNYLLMIHCGVGAIMIRSSSYSQLMGAMQAFPILGDAFAVFYPIVLILLVVVVLFNLVDRILGLFRVKQFEFDEHFDDTTIAAGERILKVEREALDRSWEGTDEEELEMEIEKDIENQKMLSSYTEPSSSVSFAAPGRKHRLPRNQAGFCFSCFSCFSSFFLFLLGLLRSLADQSESDEASHSLIPKQSNISPVSSNNDLESSTTTQTTTTATSTKSRIGDDILEI